MATIGLAGNPNSGKTSIFNSLTGAVQQVSNYPSVTVELKEGVARVNARKVQIVDLPGTYSLTAYSPEERVARNFIINERPDIVVDVVDASNLERNLYLAIQFMEMQAPLVIALNMVDIAEKRGFQIDTKRLSDLLEEAAGSRMIEELPDAVGSYRFSHALVQQTLTEELSLTARVALHARIAEALEELYGDHVEEHVLHTNRFFRQGRPGPGL